MEAARAHAHEADPDRIGAALSELGRDGALARLVRIAADTWEQFDRATIEDALSASIENAYSRSHAQDARALYCWLEQNLRFRLLNEKRDVRETERLETKLATLELTPERCASLEEQACHGPNAELAAELLSGFSPRDQSILRLAWGEGERRADIAERLEISESVVKHTLKRAGGRLQSRLCSHVGGGCGRAEEDRVRALAFQPLASVDDPRREVAQAHMQSCDACAALYYKLEQVRLGAAALTPAPVAEPGALERAGDRVLGAVDWSREQLTGAYLRAHEVAASPPPVRPGATLATLGVCAAAAGGGYCLNEAIPPLNALTQPADERTDKPIEGAPPKPEAKPAPPTATAPPTPPPPTPPQGAQPKAPAPQTPAPTPAPPTPRAQPAPPPSQAAPSPAGPQPDFEFEQRRAPVPRAPAPAPTQGGGEFF